MNKKADNAISNAFSNFPEQGQVFTKYDASTQLCAIIAIHSLTRGPALGGCRWLAYHTFNEALQDALRLAKGMSYKAAICGLPYGGGKAVIIKPSSPYSVKKYFESFASFVNQLNGKYITTADSGIGLAELDILAKHTSFITGHTCNQTLGDPSPYTAKGVLRGMEAAIKWKLKRNDFEGLHVAIQGIGNVGYCLLKYLYERGAKLTVSDTSPKIIEKCQDEFSVSVADIDNIYRVPCDIFSPCALGESLNKNTINLLNTSIIAGCANNQLAEIEDGFRLTNKNILYAPDYVINAGGLIKVAGQYGQTANAIVHQQIDNIYPRLLEIFERATKGSQPPNIIADQIALSML